MTLTPVSFANPIVPAPRRTAKPGSAEPLRRRWAPDEIKILRDNYSERGAQYCLLKLPGRNLGQIYQHANKIGLTGQMGYAPRVHVEVTPEFDAQIRDEWLAMTGKIKGEVAALADKLGVRRHWLSQRALKLGLTVPRVAKEPPWSQAELELLKSVPLHDPRRASKIFRANGFVRTPTSIMLKSNRVGMSRRWDATLSAGKAAKILGMDGKAFTTWIAKGVIVAERRETQRLPQQGGHPFSIERAYFRQWIIDNIEIIDIRKVDKFAFVDILTRSEPPIGSEAEGTQ